MEQPTTGKRCDLTENFSGQDAYGLLLWDLLRRQSVRYTMRESTSLRQETAKALLTSIRLSVDAYQQDSGASLSVLAQMEPDVLLSVGEKAVRRRVERTRLLYERARRCVLQDESISLRSTLSGMANFFRGYDARYFAGEAPCDIDYQLACPVAETLRGVNYLAAYLKALVTEDAFLRRFPTDSLHRVLAAECPDHRELLVNLYEPVAAAALGLVLTEGNFFTMDVTPAGQARLGALFAECTEQGRKKLLDDAAAVLARRLELSPAGAAYFKETAAALAGRIGAVAAAGGSWQALFPTFETC